MGKDYDNSKRRVKRVMLTLSIGVVVLSVLLLYLFSGEEKDFGRRLLNEIITGILFAGVTVCMMNVANWIIFKDDMEEKHDQDVAKRIWNLLKAERSDDSIINKLYNEESVGIVMRNSIAYFNKKLSKDFCNLINLCSKVLREDFTYNVKVSKSPDRKDCHLLEQEIRYKRHYIPDAGESFMRCGFALSNNALDAVLDDTSFFFREVISDKQMQSEIIKLIKDGQAEEVLRVLNLRIYLYNGIKILRKPKIKIYIKNTDSEIYDTNLVSKELNPEKDVIVFQIAIPDEYLLPGSNDMMCYEGQIKFKYYVPLTTNFYCAFADTMVGKTSFSITFDSGIVDNIEDNLQFITFLTCAPTMPNAGDKNSFKPITRLDDGAIYETNETIFPRSGLVVNWDPDDMNK